MVRRRSGNFQPQPLTKANLELNDRITIVDTGRKLRSSDSYSVTSRTPSIAQSTNSNSRRAAEAFSSPEDSVNDKKQKLDEEEFLNDIEESSDAGNDDGHYYTEEELLNPGKHEARASIDSAINLSGSSTVSQVIAAREAMTKDAEIQRLTRALNEQSSVISRLKDNEAIPIHPSSRRSSKGLRQSTSLNSLVERFNNLQANGAIAREPMESDENVQLDQRFETNQQNIHQRGRPSARMDNDDNNGSDHEMHQQQQQQRNYRDHRLSQANGNINMRNAGNNGNGNNQNPFPMPVPVRPANDAININIFITPHDYPSSVFGEEDMPNLERAIGSLISRNLFTDQEVVLTGAKYGAVSFNVRSCIALGILKATQGNAGWASNGHPPIRVFEEREFEIQPVLELWVPMKAVTFADALAVIHRALDISYDTSTWRCFRTIDVRARKGTSFMFISDRRTFNDVNTNNIIRFQYKFQISKATITIPIMYRQTNNIAAQLPMLQASDDFFDQLLVQGIEFANEMHNRRNIPDE
jgi:hypothetical protein